MIDGPRQVVLLADAVNAGEHIEIGDGVTLVATADLGGVVASTALNLGKDICV